MAHVEDLHPLDDAINNNYNLLLVDDDPTVIGALGKTLQELGRLRFATSGLDALRMAQLEAPDLIVLDIEMPGMDGLEVCKVLKAHPRLVDVPVILITSHDGGEHEVIGLELGAADFISKPLRPARVIARARMQLRMKAMGDALRKSAYTDALTCIANRRQFDDMLHREWHRAQRTGMPISLLMIDIDAFKNFNDHYGHPAGDKCLKAVAQAVRQSAHRPADLAARFGGEEFAVLLPETDGEGARQVVLRLLEAVRDLQLAHAASPVTDQVTVSIGVSSFDEQCRSWLGRPADSRFGNLGDYHPATDLVESADKALYTAKQAGRQQAWSLGIDDRHLPSRAARVWPDAPGAMDGARSHALAGA